MDAPVVDHTSLGASPTERRNSLERHLQMRPEAKDLKDRHILLDTSVAPYVFRSPAYISRYTPYTLVYVMVLSAIKMKSN